jgi:hypothetical protein
MSEINKLWRESKVYRIVLVLVVIYTVFRLSVHGFYLATMLVPERLPDWVGAEEPMIPNDLQDYLNGAQNLQERRNLYAKGPLSKVEFYQYAPSYALVFVPFLWINPIVVTLIHTGLHIVCYVGLFLVWIQIFKQFNLEKAEKTLIRILPIWLIFSAFWSDLGYLNIYIIAAFVATLLTKAILQKNMSQALIWLTFLLQTKPQWAFALGVPLLLGQHRFFVKLIIGAVIGYALIASMTLAIVGPSYGWEQYLDYFQFLINMPANFPWRTPSDAFLGYNHSIKQVVVYLFGSQPWIFNFATAVKVLCLVPLGLIALRFLQNPPKKVGIDFPTLALDWAFALYLGAFIWLDMVWELSLGVIIFTYLLATLKQKKTKILIWAVFLPYALVDFIQVFSFVVLGMDVITPGLYVLTDPSIYIPLIMIAILTFYILLIRRLWQTSEHLTLSEAI